MVYGYIRVSTDRQTVENQRFEVKEFAERESLNVDSWIEETISGTKEVNERKLGLLFDKMRKDDILICTELSRLGRNLMMIMGFLNQCMKTGVKVWTIKDNYRLGNDISSKVLAFAFGLSAEIERNLISQRTKEALARKRFEGKILGRPKGSLSKKRKLTGKENLINDLLAKRNSICAIARRLKVHRYTLTTFIKDFLLEKKVLIQKDTIRVDGRIFLQCKAGSSCLSQGMELCAPSINPLDLPKMDRLLDKLKEILQSAKKPGISLMLSIWQLSMDYEMN